jgi:NADH-quinone oxidoreductase subunit N
MASFPDFSPVMPEIFLACATMVLLLAGAAKGDRAFRAIAWLCVLSFAITGWLIVCGVTQGGGRVVAFNGAFVVDGFGAFVKLLILAASSLAILLCIPYLEKERQARFEYPVLIALACLGMLAMASANDLIALYIGLELQSLALYVLAAFKRDVARSSEAGLKYFVLGALSSGLLLYGASLIYGFVGSVGFDRLAEVLAQPSFTPVPMGVIVGMAFVAAGLAFKISAAPFHMWTPDVYEGAPSSVTAFFAAAPKVAAMALLIRVLTGPFGDLNSQWQQIIWFCAAASMLVGALGAIQQKNVKRLMAYSSIGHMGYALVGLAAGGPEGVRGVLLYLALYVPMTMGAFALIMSMRQDGRSVEDIADLAGLSKTHPLMALAMAIFLFSMAGVPPLAGFWGKLAVFLPAIQGGLYILAVIGVLCSAISCFYYIRIVKLMYFDDVAEPLDRPVGIAAWVMAGTALFIFPAYIFLLSPLSAMSIVAAGSLFAR